jgi:hypothetical protein
MNQPKQILLAFLIPFSLVVILVLLEDFFFPPVCTSWGEIQGEKICFEFHDESLIETGYGLLIIGLFMLSLILPPLITLRSYQGRRNQLKSSSIIE